MSKSDELRDQVNELIRDEIQEVINDYVDQSEHATEEKGFGGFVKTEEELKVNIPNDEVDKIIKEYKRIKKLHKSNLWKASKLLDKNGRPL